MRLGSKEELETLAQGYATRPAMRHGIRLQLGGNAADILLLIYWGQGAMACEKNISRIYQRSDGISILLEARRELSAFDGFGDADVQDAAVCVTQLIAFVLDDLWLPPRQP
jgi:hypothetical protein